MGHFPARFAALVLTFAEYALVGSKRGTILEAENHPAVSRNEAIVTSDLPKADLLGNAVAIYRLLWSTVVWHCKSKSG